MWDVTWTDPSKELVGEHRARKDKEGSEKNKSRSRHSASTTSSKLSSQSALSRLRAEAARQSRSSKESAATRDRDSFGLLRFTTPEAPPSTGLCSFDMSGGLMTDASMDRPMPSAAHSAAEHGASDGAGSAENGHRMASPTTISSTITSASSELDDVFSPDAKVKTRSNYQRPFARLLDDARRSSDLQSPTRQSFNFSHGRPQQSPTRSYSAKYTMTTADNRARPIPPARSPLRPASQKSHGATKSINNASAWRRPREWSLMTLISPPNRLSEAVSIDESVSAKELVKEVEDMARAPPAVALAKLKEPYSSSMSLEDHKKLSDEKERWMLSALQHLDRNGQQPPSKDDAAPTTITTTDTTTEASGPESTEKQKILAFYEPQFSARYLAALWPDKEVHHLSDRPLSFKAAPNLCAIFKPSICTPFPELTATFDAVHSMLLPALCRGGPEVLAVLHGINQCLKPGGSLRLLIIDSIPHVDAFGPKMRAWFMENIVLNLQEQSRGLNPSLSLPDVLSKASLRGPGSVLTTTQFYCNPQSIVRRHGVDALDGLDGLDEASRKGREDKELRAELRSLAGRMLWKEVWGPFVTSDTWWWEEADCMQECLELGTFWEYHSVQAVKAN
ncbi:hypothetical protein E4U41_002476 [Claviceps citrina]|nr:hypothetical protein E4U41_002476 [Claviceps citrina]